MDTKYWKESKKEALIVQNILRKLSHEMKKLNPYKNIQGPPTCSTPKPSSQIQEPIYTGDFYEDWKYLKFCQQLEEGYGRNFKNRIETHLIMNGFISGNLVMLK